MARQMRETYHPALFSYLYFDLLCSSAALEVILFERTLNAPVTRKLEQSCPKDKGHLLESQSERVYRTILVFQKRVLLNTSPTDDEQS
jgi:hypothetical protein